MNWFKNLKTSAKLMTAFGALTALMIFVGYQGITSASAINDMLNTLYEKHMIGLEYIKDVQLRVATAGRDVRQGLLCTDRGEMERAFQSAETQLNDAQESLGKAEKSLVTEEAKALIVKARDNLQAYRAEVRKVGDHAVAGRKELAIEEMTKAKSIADQLVQVSDALAATKVKVGKQAYDDSDVVYANARRNLIIVIALAALGAIGVGIYIARLIAHPLAQSVSVLESVASGDLTRTLDVNTHDEVGVMAKALNEAVVNIKNTLSEVRDAATGVASAAQELASASEELSSGAQEQASSQEETSATIEEISSTVKQNADNARQANQLAAGSRETAENGGRVVNAAVSAMGEINASSKRIADIITTIDEIAFQTNLLALNAAVEAARAGEQGRGFAVVASEVRNLAQRSATAAKEIKGLIQDSVRKVENGSDLVNQSGQTLQEIVASVKRVTDIVAEIAAASHEQAAGIEQVGKAMVQMDQVTQTNSAQTEELSSTAQTLAVHAEQMQALVARFTLESGPRRTTAAAASKPAVTKKTRPGNVDATHSLHTLSRATSQGASKPAPATVESGFGDF